MSYDMQSTMQQQYAPAPYQNGQIKSETNSERGVSPHPSNDYQSRYPQPAPPPLQAYQPMPAAMSNGMRYPSPTAMNAPMPMMNQQYLPNPPPDHAYPPQVAPDQQQQVGGRPASDTGPPKAFACSTCGKGFARRSDLARHGKSRRVPLACGPTALTTQQRGFTAAFVRTFATTPTAASSSSSALL